MKERELEKDEGYSYNPDYYVVVHLPSGRAWEKEWDKEYTGLKRLELINTWNRMGHGVWQYYTI